MGALSDILRVGDQAVQLGDWFDWLPAFEKLGDRWAEILEQVKEIKAGAAEVDSAASLFAFLQGELENETVSAAFEELGLTAELEQLRKLAKLYDKLPPQLKRLAQPVSDFVETVTDDPDTDEPRPLDAEKDGWVDGSDPGKVELPIPKLALDHGAHAGSADFTFSLGASAEISAEAGALWPYARDEVTPGLIQLTLGGSIEAGAKGAIPFSSGEVKASAGAGVSAALMFFARPAKADGIYAAELVHMLPKLPNPFSLEEVWNATDGGHIEGLIVALDGHAEVAVSVSVGKSVDLPKVLSGKLGFTGSISLKRKAGYVLSVRSSGKDAGKGRLKVVLSRNKSAADTWGLGLGLELDISPLVDRVHAVLEDVLGVWSEKIAVVQPYLKPGTWIRSKLQDEFGELVANLVSDETIRSGLIEDFGLLLGSSDADESKLVKLLSDKLQQKLDKVEDLAFGEVDKKAAEVVDEVTAWLPALGSVDVRALLQAKVKELIGGFQTDLAARLQQLSTTVDAGEIGDALKSIGLKLDQKVKTADDALAGLRKLVQKFDDVLHRAVKITEDAAIKKIGAQLSFEDSRVREFDMEVVGHFTADTAGSRALYSSLTKGKLSALQQLLLDGTTVEGFELVKEESSIHRFTRVSKKLGYAFVGFGAELTGSQLISGEADIVVTGDGNVTLSAKAEAQVSGSSFAESRSTTFVSTYDMLLAKADDDDGEGRPRNLQQSLSLDLTASHRDESLKAGEVIDFFAGLASLGLISDHRTKKASTIYEAWSPTGGSDGTHPKGDIEVKLSLKRDRLDVLLALGQGILAEFESKRFATTKTVFEQGYDAMIATGQWSEHELSGLIDKLRKDFPPHDKTLTNRQWLIYYTQSVRLAGGADVKKHHKKVLNAEIGADAQFGRIVDVMLSLSALADVFQLMAEVYDAKVDLTGKHGWDDKDYAECEESLADASSNWLGTGRKLILWFRRTMSPQTTALLAALVALSQGASVKDVKDNVLGDPFFKITMIRRTGAEGETLKPEPA